MFEFFRLGEAITSLVGSPQGSEPAYSADLRDLLQQVGLDPSALAGLSESQITELLANLGIDPAQFVGGQLDQLLADFGVNENLAAASEGIQSIKGVWRG